MIEIRIKDGEIRFIYNDDLMNQMKNLGKTEVKRASHVEPDDNGTWKVDLTPVGGPITTGYDRRDVALQAEVNWLLENNIPKPN